jgi:hypothetical protein
MAPSARVFRGGAGRVGSGDMEESVNAKQLKRLLALGAVISLAALTTFVVPASAARTTSKVVLIGSSIAGEVNDPGPTGTGQAKLTFTPVTAGNLTFFDVVVKNAGGQTLNNVVLSVGYDDNATVESVRPVASTLTPTFPVAFPTGTVTLSSFTGTGCTAADATLGRIDCAVGTLTTGSSFHLEVVLATSVGASVPLKAVTKVAENTNDNGSNQDTFAAEGVLTVAPFSCVTSSAYLPGNSDQKTLDTCPLAGTHRESLGVKFPGRLTTLTLKEDGTANLCPTTACFGSTFVADIADDAATDIVTWTVQIDLVPLGKTNLNLNKLIVYHYDDAGVLSPAGGIANTKANKCTTGGSNCIESATIVNDILTVVYRSNGNGSTRMG